MGFYAPAQIVGDARKNGVEVREIDVSHSFAENTLEETSGKYCAVRLGFRQIDGFGWIDRDEERLKQQQLLFRDNASTSSFRDAPQGAGPESITTAGGYGFRARRFAAPRNDE
jgi:error-prone DNA polymerase